MTIVNKDFSDPISSQQVNNFSLNAPAHFIHEHIMHEYHHLHKEKIFSTAPIESKQHPLSILSSEIPITLLEPCRQVHEKRLNNTNFITASDPMG